MKPLLCAALALTCVFPALAPAAAADSKPAAPAGYWVFFGTYTKGKSEGIYRARLDVATGKLSAAEVAATCSDPAFLALHPNGQYLYAIDEGSDPARTPGRGLTAFAVDARTGALQRLNDQSSGGPGPCHLEVDRTGRTLLVANYSGGSVASLPIGADGRIGPATTVRRHEGSSVHPTRQQRPHAHGIYVSPDNRRALVPDLGIDRVMVYQLDAAGSTLTPNTPPSAALPPGSGPRHLAFHPNGRFVYVINELLCTMAVFAYDAAAGALQPVQSVSTLPAGTEVARGFSTAEVMVHPSGRFVYGSNRGHNTIVVYAADPQTGRLTYVENEPTQGQTPRHFAVDPTGKWLLAENQGSDTVVVLQIDPATGALAPTGNSLAVPSPVSAVFVAVK